MTEHELEEALGICCGNASGMRDHIHKTLQLLHLRSERNNGGLNGGWERGTEALIEHLGDLYSPVNTVYLHFLDRLDLIEHGSGISGSWLTNEGERVLEELNKRAPLESIVEATKA